MPASRTSTGDVVAVPDCNVAANALDIAKSTGLRLNDHQMTTSSVGSKFGRTTHPRHSDSFVPSSVTQRLNMHTSGKFLPDLQNSLHHQELERLPNPSFECPIMPAKIPPLDSVVALDCEMVSTSDEAWEYNPIALAR